mgnify:CR=1 FL=1
MSKIDQIQRKPELYIFEYLKFRAAIWQPDLKESTGNKWNQLEPKWMYFAEILTHLPS